MPIWVLVIGHRIIKTNLHFNVSVVFFWILAKPEKKHAAEKRRHLENDKKMRQIEEETALKLSKFVQKLKEKFAILDTSDFWRF